MGRNLSRPIKHPTATTSLGSRTRQAGGDGPPSTSKGKKNRWRPGDYAEKKVSRDHPGNTIVGIFLGGFTMDF